MDKEIVVRLHSSFEDMVRKHPDTGTEFWCARDLQMLLGYLQWRSFADVIDKAITTCQNAGYEPRDHFAHISKMVDLGSGSELIRAVDVMVANANESLRSVRERCEAGASPVTDLLDAEAALTHAQAIQVQAHGDYGIARATLQWALGNLGT